MPSDRTISQADAEPRPMPSLGEAGLVWARIGLLSFGGPAGQIALMHRMLVEERGWLGEQRFLHALNYCMLLPGPEAQQLATYIGWLMHRTLGGLVAGLLFVVPGALVILGLSFLYVSYREVPLIDAAFLGVKAAVFAIVVQAVIRIGRRALRSRIKIAIAAAAFLLIFVLGVPFPLIVIAAGVVGLIGGRIVLEHGGHATSPTKGREHGLIDAAYGRGDMDHVKPTWRRSIAVLGIWLTLWIVPVAAVTLLTGGSSVWSEIAGLFSLTAVVTFGGAYAVLAFVAQAAVEWYGWLAPGEMIDGLGMAETTPGPLILVLEFVGFVAAYRLSGPLDPIVAGSLAAMLTLWVTFVPCFLWIFLGAPYVEALRENRALSTALSAITAAVVGVVLNLAIWFGLHVIFAETTQPFGFGLELPVPLSIDWRAALLASLAVLVMFRFRLGVMPTLGLSAALAIVLTFV